MELINKNHRSIKNGERRSAVSYFKMESSRVLVISRGAVKEFGFIEGMYVHFHDAGRSWFFQCNTDDNGFKLHKRPTHYDLQINNMTLVQLITKRTGASIKTKFPVQLSASKIQGNHLFEIDFSKPFD